MKSIAVCLTCCLLLSTMALGQCPDKQSLWQTIIYLRDSSPASTIAIKSKLLQYEREIAGCPYQYDSLHVLLLRSVAMVSFREENYLEVIPYLQQSIRLIRRIPNNPAVDSKLLPNIYYWIAFMYQKLNNVSERMKALDSCIITGNQLQVINRSVLCALYDKTMYYFDMGDYHHCIDYAELCERKAWEYIPIADEADRSVSQAYALSSFVWRVNSYVQLKQYEKAESLLNTQLAKTAGSNMKVYQGTIHGLRAEMELHKANYDQSVSLFDQATTFEHKAGHALGYRQLLNTLGYEVYFKHFKNNVRALATFRKALHYVNKDAASREANIMESLSICTNMAEVYVQQDLYDSANRCFRLALDCIRPGIQLKEVVSRPPEEFITQKKIHYLTALVIGQADAYRKQYSFTKDRHYLEQAIAVYRMADQLVGRIREEQSSIHSKLFWRSNSHALYEHALDACYTSGRMEDAFYFFEKSRAVLLNDQLTEQRWLGEGEIYLQKQVKTKINSLQRALAASGLSDKQQADVNLELLDQQRKLDSLAGIIKQRNPFYYQSFMETDFVQLKQVQKAILQEYQALVELFSGDSAVYLLTITATDTRLQKIDKDAFDTLSGMFANYVANLDLQNANWDAFLEVSHQLYTLLFGKDGLPPGRIIVSPDGRYFPFEALAVRAKPEVSWLLEQHAISYTYSVRYLLNDFAAKAGNASKSFMGIAPVHYNYARLPALYESDQSLDVLTHYFDGAAQYTGAAASRQTFLRQFGDYRIIQLYTHAADNRAEGEPVIWFADSSLYLSDLISDKKPATQLVVLSACETGTGKFYQGEGVFSFNRGFAALGIPAAITSLWSADNKKTYELTRLFYKNLAAGMPADLALQQAKLTFIKNGPLQNTMPWAWAVPVLTGKVMPLVPQPQTSYKWLWVLAGVILLWVIIQWLIAPWVKRSRRRNSLAWVSEK